LLGREERDVRMPGILAMGGGARNGCESCREVEVEAITLGWALSETRTSLFTTARAAKSGRKEAEERDCTRL
jgi:hypothetical protein